MSPTGQIPITAVETARRSLVGLARDYPAGFAAALYAHPWAQLLYAVSGVMCSETRRAAFTVPPSMALFLPAHVPHGIRMDGPVAMRALFLREDAAIRARPGTDVIAVSRLLREVVLAACVEPLHWNRRGRALAGGAGVGRDRPGDGGAARPADPVRPTSVSGGLVRLFRTKTGLASGSGGSRLAW